MKHSPDQIRTAIAFHGKQCESALRAAATAAEANLSSGMVNGLRKLAAIHSADAFAWARHPHPEGGAA